MFKWAVLLFVAYVLFGADRSMIYEEKGPSANSVEKSSSQDFRPEVYEEPEFLSDCIEYEMDICFEPNRKRAKF